MVNFDATATSTVNQDRADNLSARIVGTLARFFKMSEGPTASDIEVLDYAEQTVAPLLEALVNHFRVSVQNGTTPGAFQGLPNGTSAPAGAPLGLPGTGGTAAQSNQPVHRAADNLQRALGTNPVQTTMLFDTLVTLAENDVAAFLRLIERLATEPSLRLRSDGSLQVEEQLANARRSAGGANNPNDEFTHHRTALGQITNPADRQQALNDALAVCSQRLTRRETRLIQFIRNVFAAKRLERLGMNPRAERTNVVIIDTLAQPLKDGLQNPESI